MPNSDGRSWRREPLLHFIVLGGLLFAVGRWRDHRSDKEGAPIVVDTAQRQRLDGRFEKQRGRVATDAERTQLVEDWVDEQLLYREGLTLGLDRGDPVIERRIIDKMKFVAAEQAVIEPPDDATLQRFVREHPDRYVSPPRRDFVLVTFGGEHARSEADKAVERMRNGAGLRDVGGRVATGKRFTRSNTLGTYGPEIAAAVERATVGQWVLVTLSNGCTALRVDGVADSEAPPLDKIRTQAALDWTEQQRADAVADRIDGIRDRYDVVVDP